MDQDFEVFLGLDVGRVEHRAGAIDSRGNRLYNAVLPNSELRLRTALDQLAQHGPMLVVVEESAKIDALPIAVARAYGHEVACLTGAATRQLAARHSGRRADGHDPFVTAEAARTLPDALRRVTVCDDTLAELKVLISYDEELAAEATRLTDHIRGLLSNLHPALERVFGPMMVHPAVLEILIRCGGPVGIRAAGRDTLTAITINHVPRMDATLVPAIMTALDEQTVEVPGTMAADRVLPWLAEGLKSVVLRRQAIAAEVDKTLQPYSVPGA